jgi:SAM-dependent methyltransferase
MRLSIFDRVSTHMGLIDRSEGKRAFGSNPDGYHRSRPAYPERVFEILQQRCGLRPHCKSFEIGGGTGLSTRRLIELGASPIVVVEPDERLANFLVRTLEGVDVRVTTFEKLELPSESFEMGTSASAFHWLDEAASLRKIGRILRDEGWWAMWWNLFLDPSRTDEFHKATRTLLEGLDRGPSHGSNEKPSFAMDTQARIAQLKAAGVFDQIEIEDLRWSAVFDSVRVRELYATFSPISRLGREERERLLDGLGEIAERQFGGSVELYITTPIYTARRKARTRGSS